MFVNETGELKKQSMNVEKWLQTRIEQFAKFKPDYWMVGDASTGTFQINLFGYRTVTLPKECFKRIFRDEKNLSTVYFAGVVCIYQVLNPTPENTSIIVTLDSQIKVPVTGMFIIGTEEPLSPESAISGMDSDTCIKVLSQLELNSSFQFISLMEP